MIYWSRIYHDSKIKCWFDVKRTNVYVNLPPNSPGLSSVLRGLHTLEREGGGGEKKNLTPHFLDLLVLDKHQRRESYAGR